MNKGLLLIVRGLPGSGKTTCINEVTILSDSVRLDPDKVDIFSPEFVSFSEEYPPTLPIKKKVYRYLLQKACAALPQGKVVVWEQPWRNRDLFLLTLQNIATIGYGIQSPQLSSLPFKVAIIEISISSDEALDRVTKRFEKRSHPLTPCDFTQFHESLEHLDDLGLPFVCFDGMQTLQELTHNVQNFISVQRKDVV